MCYAVSEKISVKSVHGGGRGSHFGGRFSISHVFPKWANRYNLGAEHRIEGRFAPFDPQGSTLPGATLKILRVWDPDDQPGGVVLFSNLVEDIEIRRNPEN